MFLIIADSNSSALKTGDDDITSSESLRIRRKCWSTGLAKYIEIKISAMENMFQFFKLTICTETGDKSLT